MVVPYFTNPFHVRFSILAQTRFSISLIALSKRILGQPCLKVAVV
jgi:hypothetical protein